MTVEPRQASVLVFKWLGLIFDERDLAAAWPLMEPAFRLATVQGWVMLNHDLPGVRHADRAELAQSLTRLESVHPLWTEFAGWRVIRWREVWPHFVDPWERSVRQPDVPEFVSPDLEVVRCTHAVEAGRVRGSDQPALYHQFLVRHVEDDVLVAGVGGRLPVPGWPPSEVEPRF